MRNHLSTILFITCFALGCTTTQKEPSPNISRPIVSDRTPSPISPTPILNDRLLSKSTPSPVPKEPMVGLCDGPTLLKADGTVGPLCLEEQLIIADTEGHLPDHALEVNRARFLINFLETHTTTGQKEIADKAFKTSEMIKNKYGLPYTGLKVLEDSRSMVLAMPLGKKEDFGKITYLVYMQAGSR